MIEGDGLPGGMCLNCMQELHKVVSFRKLCEKSDATLRLCLATFLQEQNENEQKVQEFVCNSSEKRTENEENVSGCLLQQISEFC